MRMAKISVAPRRVKPKTTPKLAKWKPLPKPTTPRDSARMKRDENTYLGPDAESLMRTPSGTSLPDGLDRWAPQNSFQDGSVDTFIRRQSGQNAAARGLISEQQAAVELRRSQFDEDRIRALERGNQDYNTSYTQGTQSSRDRLSRGLKDADDNQADRALQIVSNREAAGLSRSSETIRQRGELDSDIAQVRARLEANSSEEIWRMRGAWETGLGRLREDDARMSERYKLSYDEDMAEFARRLAEVGSGDLSRQQVFDRLQQEKLLDAGQYGLVVGTPASPSKLNALTNNTRTPRALKWAPSVI